MFYITGDTHGNWLRFYPHIFTEQKEMTKKDYVLILGDFGIWDNSEWQQKELDILNNRPFTTLFVSGNHSNYDILNNLPVNEWKGGKVNFIRNNIIHLKRGQIFNIDGRKIFTFGGASSHDIQDGVLELESGGEEKFIEMRNKGKRVRVNHKSWWKEELPTVEEIKLSKDKIIDAGMNVDYIFSHCAPNSIQKIVTQNNPEYQENLLTDFFEWIKNNVKYGQWAFGHYHKNMDIDMKHHCLYEDIVRMW